MKNCSIIQNFNTEQLVDCEDALVISLKIFLQKPIVIRVDYKEIEPLLSIYQVELFLFDNLPHLKPYFLLTGSYYKQFHYRKNKESPIEFVEEKDWGKENINTGYLFIQFLPMGNSRASQIAKGTLKGASTGAGLGALIGSIIPGIGTAIGAVVGGVIGGAAGAAYSTWQTGVEARQSEISSLALERINEARQLTRVQPIRITPGRKLQSKELAKEISDNRVDGGSPVPEMFGQLRVKGRAITKVYLSNKERRFFYTRYFYNVLYSFGEGPVEFSAHRFKTFHPRALRRFLQYYDSSAPTLTEFDGANENEPVDVPGQNLDLEDFDFDPNFPEQDRSGRSISLDFESDDTKTGQTRIRFNIRVTPQAENESFSRDSFFSRNKDLWFLGYYDYERNPNNMNAPRLYTTRAQAVAGAVALGHTQPLAQGYSLAQGGFVACWPRSAGNSLPSFIIATGYVNDDAQPDDLPENVSVINGVSPSLYASYKLVFLTAQDIEDADNFLQISLPVIGDPFVNEVRQVRVYRVNINSLIPSGGGTTNRFVNITPGGVPPGGWGARSWSRMTGAGNTHGSISDASIMNSGILAITNQFIIVTDGFTPIPSAIEINGVSYPISNSRNNWNQANYGAVDYFTISPVLPASGNWNNLRVRFSDGTYSPTIETQPSSEAIVNCNSLSAISTSHFNPLLVGSDFLLSNQAESVLSPDREAMVFIEKVFQVDDPPSIPNYPDAPEEPDPPASPPSSDYTAIPTPGGGVRYVISTSYINRLRAHQDDVKEYNKRVVELKNRYDSRVEQWNLDADPFAEIYNKFREGANDFSSLTKRKIYDLLNENVNSRNIFEFQDNPVKIFVYVLQQFIQKQKLNLTIDDIIERDDFIVWRDFCDTNNLKFNGIFDFETRVSEVLKTLAFVGMADIDFSFGKMRPIVKKPRSMVMQYFHTRNMSDLQYVRAKVNLPDVIVAEFLNKDKNYRLDELKSYSPGFSAATAVEEERISLLGVTDPAQARKYLELQRRQYQNINESWTFNTDIMGVVAQKGDLVGLNHFELKNTQFSCRIRGLLRDENDMVKGVQIDQENTPDLLVDPSLNFACIILCANGTEQQIQVSRFSQESLVSDLDNLAESEGNLITTRQGENIGARPKKWKSMIFSSPQDPRIFCGEVGDYVLFGELTEVYRECLISSLSIARDFTVSVVLTPYNSSLYAQP